MLIEKLTIDNFRSYTQQKIELSSGLNVAFGHNGAGKTNLLEAIYFSCTGRSCRTANERELISYWADQTAVVAEVRSEVTSHRISTVMSKKDGKKFKLDGYQIDRLAQFDDRPLVVVFLPDRLSLIKGQPATRRGHLDQLCAVINRGYEPQRRKLAEITAQRNALLIQIKQRGSSDSTLDLWDQQLVTAAAPVAAVRSEVISSLAPLFTERSHQLGVNGKSTISYRSTIDYADENSYLELLQEKRTVDVTRGFSGYGPHRDDLRIEREGKEIKRFASQGEQRLTLLSLLISEHEMIAKVSGRAPLLLLDDVMSELDMQRRQLLTDILSDVGGQVLITTTDLQHVPNSDREDTRYFQVCEANVERVDYVA